MTMPKPHNLEDCIKFINDKASGKPIILHTDLGNISQLLSPIGKTRDQVFRLFYEILKVNCSASSIFIPTFDYEYCSSRYYNPSTSISQLGAFSRYCARTFSDSRTLVPVFNHVDIKGFHKPTNDLYRIDRAFGIDSFYDWFTHQDGFIFFWGCKLEYSNTYIHHAETISQVSYRYRKVFQGQVQTEQSVIEIGFEYNVKNQQVDIDYIDQGKQVIAAKDYLLCQEGGMIEGFSSQKYLSAISDSLVHDEFALITGRSRIEISRYLADHRNLREITEDKNSIILLSDSSLEFITRGWDSAYDIKPIYAESLILDLERLCQTRDLKCSALLIMPSLDSFSIGMLHAHSSSSSKLHNDLEAALAEFIVRIKKIRYSHPTLIIVFISPFRSSLASELADSQKSELEIIEMLAKLDRRMFNELDAINVGFEKVIQSTNLTRGIYYSAISYLRYRYPFDIASTSEIRNAIEQIINKQFLHAKEIKAISVDLDNTLWRGIAGDETAEISKDFPSNTSLALQKVLKQLRDRGVFLTVTSKNDISTIRETFRKFDGKMFLSLADFSCVEANWQAKSNSLLKQAAALNIGIDSFLHIDDSDLELLEIMSSLPKVETLKFVPENIDYILNYLLSHPRLKKASLTQSDVARIQNSKNLASVTSSSSKSRTNDLSYIESLEIALSVTDQDSDLFDFKRSCQLLSKTNQFNTSQMTYELLAADFGSTFKVFNLLYSDKYSLQECCSVICAMHDISHDELIVTSFVLSCRFFARGLEYFFLKNVWERYQSERLSVVFRRSRKNLPALDYINTIAYNSAVTIQAAEKSNYLTRLSIDLSKLSEMYDKYQNHYAQFKL